MEKKRSDTSRETNEKTIEILQAGEDEYLTNRLSSRDRRQGADT